MKPAKSTKSTCEVGGSANEVWTGAIFAELNELAWMGALLEATVGILLEIADRTNSRRSDV